MSAIEFLTSESLALLCAGAVAAGVAVSIASVDGGSRDWGSDCTIVSFTKANRHVFIILPWREVE